MPIRLNLLAEAQAAEDMRRRDPVKRAVWAGVVIISSMLIWSSSVQFKAMLAGNELSRIETQMTAHTNQYQQVLAHQQKAAEFRQKVAALRKLSAERLLNGTLLNALQQTTVHDVQLVRLRVDQTYNTTEALPQRTNDNRVLPGKPAAATERIVLTLEGDDSSPNPGDQINKLKEAIASNCYFKDVLAKTNSVNLKSLSPPQISPESGKPCVLFSLECRYPERTR